MVKTGKANVTNNARNFDVVVYPVTLRRQGKKVMIQKGTCKISIPLADLLPLVAAVVETGVEATRG